MEAFFTDFMEPAINMFSGANPLIKFFVLDYARNPADLNNPSIWQAAGLLKVEHLDEKLKHELRQALSMIKDSDSLVEEALNSNTRIDLELINTELRDFLKFAFRFAACRKLEETLSKVEKALASYYKSIYHMYLS